MTGIRLRDLIDVGNVMWGSDHPQSESTFAQSPGFWRRCPKGVPDDERAKPAPDPDPGIAALNTGRADNFDVTRLTVPG